ncbi:MAG: hypothetical protein DCC65_04470 [Planctomycetota bacterium]|nr:MAG: hypothetical protein DCC65_04470 [Planctomycetota bacterium]
MFQRRRLMAGAAGLCAIVLVAPAGLRAGDSGGSPSAKPLTSPPVAASPHVGADVSLTGRLSEVDGVPLLVLWGTQYERGFTHGYLLAEKIVGLFDGYLRETVRGAEAIENFETTARRHLKAMNFAPRYLDELRGMHAGVVRRLGDAARIETLDRQIALDDLVAVACIPELARIGCSSFAAWGPLTADGHTISGRNLDWHRLNALQSGQMVVAYAPGPEDGRLGWLSVTWPGYIGCLTGMNSEGVTVAMHDVFAGPPTAPLGFTPRGFALRDAVETAHAATAGKDVLAVLRGRIAAVGNNVPISFPYRGGNKESAVVFEYDGDLTNGVGVTVRRAQRSGSAGDATAYLPCTNHYRKRASAESCDRYEKIDRRMKEIARSGQLMTVADGWDILRMVACRSGPRERIQTYHSVVFEPNFGRMHAAFSTPDRAAPENKPVTFDVRSILDGAPPAPAP